MIYPLLANLTSGAFICDYNIGLLPVGVRSLHPSMILLTRMPAHGYICESIETELFSLLYPAIAISQKLRSAQVLLSPRPFTAVLYP